MVSKNRRGQWLVDNNYAKDIIAAKQRGRGSPKFPNTWSYNSDQYETDSDCDETDSVCK